MRSNHGLLDLPCRRSAVLGLYFRYRPPAASSHSGRISAILIAEPCPLWERTSFSIPSHICLQPLLVLQIHLPTDVTRMMIEKQYLPFFLRLSIAGTLANSSLLDHGMGSRLAVGKRSAVAGILEHLSDSATARQGPGDFPPCSAGLNVWH